MFTTAGLTINKYAACWYSTKWSIERTRHQLSRIYAWLFHRRMGRCIRRNRKNNRAEWRACRRTLSFCKRLATFSFEVSEGLTNILLLRKGDNHTIIDVRAPGVRLGHARLPRKSPAQLGYKQHLFYSEKGTLTPLSPSGQHNLII